MVITDSRDPAELLAALEARYRQGAAGLPMQEQAHDYWRGIGFELAGVRLLAPLDKVAEILPVPPLTRVPLTKRWVLGIANVRGNLLPVMDLLGFLEGRAATLTPASRVLAVVEGDFSTGLLVDRVTGLQQIDVDARFVDTPSAGDGLRPFLDGGYTVHGEAWPLLDFARLAAHGEFMQAAA